jgi:hypothetical protein
VADDLLHGVKVVPEIAQVPVEGVVGVVVARDGVGHAFAGDVLVRQVFEGYARVVVAEGGLPGRGLAGRRAGT